MNTIRFKLSISQLLKLKNHLGGTLSTLNNAGGNFVFGYRWSILLLDVRLSILYIRRSLGLLMDISYKNGQLFFFGNNLRISQLLHDLIPYWQKRRKRESASFTRPIFNMATPRRWWGGFLTNFKEWCRWFNYMSLYCKKFHFYGWKKPDIMLYLRQLNNRFRFQDFFYFSTMIPPVLINFDLTYQPLIKNETFKLNIPLVSFINASVSPVGVCYPIISSSHSSFLDVYLLSLFILCGLIGRGRRIKQFRNGLWKIRKYLLKYKKIIRIENTVLKPFF